MKTLRNLAIAGALAIAASFSSGSANAAPAALEIGIGAPIAAESAVQPAFHYGNHFQHGGRLCHVPFFKLVQWFGYWGAKRIKARCFGHYYYY